MQDAHQYSCVTGERERTGFVGYGHMGSMLVNGFIASGALAPGDVAATTRRKGSLNDLAARWPEITIAESIAELGETCSRVVICVRPLDVKGVLRELTPDLHVVSIAAAVDLASMERVFPGRITRAMPSIASGAGGGITLICHNGRVGDADAREVERLFSTIGEIVTLPEEDMPAAVGITGCGPGLLAAVLQEYVEAGVRHSNLSRKDAEAMVRAMLSGTALLFREQTTAFADLIEQVATPGGITEAGVTPLQRELPQVFDRMFEEMLRRHESVRITTAAQFDDTE